MIFICIIFYCHCLLDHPSVVKKFYIENPDTANRTPLEVAQIRAENNNIVVNDLNDGEPRDIPNPAVTFEESFEHYPDIMDCIYKAGFKEPTPIQKQAWPCALLVSTTLKGSYKWRDLQWFVGHYRKKLVTDSLACIVKLQFWISDDNFICLDYTVSQG